MRLTAWQLNRATIARQLLLRREPLDPVELPLADRGVLAEAEALQEGDPPSTLEHQVLG